MNEYKSNQPQSHDRAFLLPPNIGSDSNIRNIATVCEDLGNCFFLDNNFESSIMGIASLNESLSALDPSTEEIPGFIINNVSEILYLAATKQVNLPPNLQNEFQRHAIYSISHLFALNLPLHHPIFHFRFLEFLVNYLKKNSELDESLVKAIIISLSNFCKISQPEQIPYFVSSLPISFLQQFVNSTDKDIVESTVSLVTSYARVSFDDDSALAAIYMIRWLSTSIESNEIHRDLLTLLRRMIVSHSIMQYQIHNNDLIPFVFAHLSNHQLVPDALSVVYYMIVNLGITAKHFDIPAIFALLSDDQLSVYAAETVKALIEKNQDLSIDLIRQLIEVFYDLPTNSKAIIGQAILLAALHVQPDGLNFFIDQQVLAIFISLIDISCLTIRTLSVLSHLVELAEQGGQINNFANNLLPIIGSFDYFTSIEPSTVKEEAAVHHFIDTILPKFQ